MPKTLLILTLLALCASLSFCVVENSAEELFKAIPNPAEAYGHLAFYTSIPHIAGSPGDYETAVYTYNKFLMYGLTNVSILEEEVLLTYPLSRSVSVVSPATHVYNCSLEEDYVSVDPTSNNPHSVPTFNGYSPSGDVTAEVVYVNYGGVEDYAALKELGIEVNGKIVIARYGQIFRGTIAMLAEMNGAVGVLLYSDPADDGYVQGPVYPEGPWRSNSSVQRGSAQFLSLCPGNPGSPHCVPPEERSTYDYKKFIPSIPVQPLSYKDAAPILLALANTTEAPAPFQGGLPFTYYLGPGPGQVNIKLEIEFVNSTIWNVVGTIAADETSPTANERVYFGNHRDAWVFGAVDPNSGTSVMLEVARGLGELVRKGQWIPQRQLVFCSWDGEEYGLLGSTAYANSHMMEIQKEAVAYINLDSSISGNALQATGRFWK